MELNQPEDVGIETHSLMELNQPENKKEVQINTLELVENG
jgi:hypothetical protein